MSVSGAMQKVLQASINCMMSKHKAIASMHSISLKAEGVRTQ
jgi:hypothetical protein